MSADARGAATLSIGELARRTGTKVETVRWYEREGLLPAPARTGGGHRAYTRAHLDRLAFIRHARELGFPLVPRHIGFDGLSVWWVQPGQVVPTDQNRDAPCHAWLA